MLENSQRPIKSSEVEEQNILSLDEKFKILLGQKSIESKEIEENNSEIFWNSRQTKETTTYSFDVVALAGILEKNGFAYGFLEKENPLAQRLIKVSFPTIEETTIKTIQAFCQGVIEKANLKRFERQEILALWKKQNHYLITENTINLLKQYTTWKKENGFIFLEMLTDTKDKAFFPFKNGVVEISKTGIALKSYETIKKYVWKSQVIDHDFSMEESKEIENFDFFKFLQNTCTEKNKELDFNRFMALRYGLGYILHDYKRSFNKKALILSEASLDEDPQGRTGKGLIMQAVGKLRKTVTLDGRLFRFDSVFCYQNVTLDTKILFFDDIKPNFDFRKLYSAITEGLSFEKKGKDRINLSPEESPKITLSTNYAIKGNSESDKGRKIEIELLCHYTSKDTPFKEFGRNFFDDGWKVKDWNLFYNTMFSCVSEFFVFDEMPEYNSETIEEKRLRLEFGNEFLEFMEELLNKIKETGQKDFSVSSVYLDFCREIEDKEQWKQQAFTKAVRRYAKDKKIKMEYSQKRQGDKKVYYFCF
jgi:hypothetical protein